MQAEVSIEPEEYGDATMLEWLTSAFDKRYDDDEEEGYMMYQGESSSSQSESPPRGEPAEILIQKTNLNREKVRLAIDSLSKARPLPLELAFELAVASARGLDITQKLPARAHASPLVPSFGMSYIVRRRQQHKSRSVKGPDAVRVSFQSVLNSDIYWPSTYAQLGVATRPMSRGLRPGAEQMIDSQATEDHGYRGRMYTLVYRPLPTNTIDSSYAVKSPSVSGSKRRRQTQVTALDLGIVHTWKEDEESSNLLIQRKRSSSSIVFRNKTIDDLHEQAPFGSKSSDEHSTTSDGTTYWNPPLSHVHIPGDLRVEGKIYGVLNTEPQAADYAEFFYWDEYDLLENGSIRPGSVVRLKSPEQRLTLDTSGPGPCLIISTKPAIAAGVPRDPIAASRGALAAFIGQVPVRCSGRVECGDQLVPSGNNDGLALSLEERCKHDDESEDEVLFIDPLGIAMQSSDGKEEEQEVLAFVRWNDAVRREVGTQVDKALEKQRFSAARILIDVITSLSIGLIILDVQLLACITISLLRGDIESTSPHHIYTFISIATGFASFVLIIFLFVGFKHQSKERRLATGLIFFWFGYAILALVFSVILVGPYSSTGRNSRSTQLQGVAALIMLKAYSIIYNAHIILIMAKFRAVHNQSNKSSSCCPIPLHNRTPRHSNTKKNSPFASNTNHRPRGLVAPRDTPLRARIPSRTLTDDSQDTVVIPISYDEDTKEEFPEP